MDYLSFLVCLLLAWLAIHLLLSTTKASGSVPKQLPPGPPPLPIVGNLLSLGTKPHVSMAEFTKTYGPIMILRLGQLPTVVISSASMAKEAVQRHDLSFSDRTITDAFRAFDHHLNSIVWLPPAAQWRNLRKICNSHVFSNSRLECSQNLRRNKVKDLISYIRKSSEAGTAVDIGQAAFTTTLNLLSSTFFSMDLGDPSSEIAREFRHLVRGLLEEGGKPNLSNYFPMLRWLDPQGIRRRTGVHFKKMIDLFNTIIDQRMQGRKPTNSMQDNDVLDALLGINQEKTADIDPSKIPHLLLDLFTAGTDTTSSTLEWAMAELLHNPEKLKKAQAEIEQIVGRTKPVEESDIPRLPYLQAVIKETFRLHPAVPFNFRRSDSDVNLCGFTVPKNAQVLMNFWAIGRDPEFWDNPNLFKPERFLGSEIDVKGRDFELIPFGAGRRICPGLPLAIRMLHLMLGSLIHEFNWKLEEGISPATMDMEEKFGFTLEKSQRLRAIPVPP
uniref:Cytochrome P450 76F84 n=1 Tax=Mollugo verticillata TaxID=3592 RepID=A0A0X9RCZ9_MOLVE|nr:cytochrome P450 76F84 [Mollugo verticillata]